jgi:hypothetical protein
MTLTGPLRAVVIPASGWWIIQFVDYDMATVTRDFDLLEDEVRELLETNEKRSRDEGYPPWSSYEPPPPEYQERFERASPVATFAVEVSAPGIPRRVIVDLRLEGVQ